MRIVLDLQGAQTESRFRGIGRYSLSLAQAIVRNRGEHEVLIALSGLFPETIDAIRESFDGLLAQENIVVWHAPGPVRECDPGNAWRRDVAERVREAFLASLRPDVVHLSSLFEGYGDDAVTSIGVFGLPVPTVVTLYDLIPLLNPAVYLDPNPEYAGYYRRKIEHLKRASQWLSISESTSGEGCGVLDLPASAVVNISSGCDSVFRQLAIPESEKQQLLGRFGIAQPFILYSGGADARKNIARLILAYTHLPKALQASHQLVLAGKMHESDVARLRKIARSAGVVDGQLVFTGYVSDEDLARLYNLCTVFVLPSYHEGFGLPVLEAMACGAAAIGANTSSVPEVVGREDALFDAYDELAISRKLAQVLGDDAFRAELAAHGVNQARKFTWDESARRAIAAFEQLHASSVSPRAPVGASARRPTLAFVSPFPPDRSGIADYSAELLPALAKYYDIELVLPQERVVDGLAPAKVHDPQWLRANAQRVDRVLYQFGNSPFHQHMLTLLEDVPGTVVLHDFFLSGLLGYLEESGAVPDVWTRALYHAHGYAAVRERYHDGDAAAVKVKYPVNLDVLQNARGVIVHSEYSRRLAGEWFGPGFAADWQVIPLLRAPLSGADRARSRAALGLQEDDFVVCSFGFLAPTKLNHRLLDAWLSSRLARDPRCVLWFVGENHGGDYGAQLSERITASGLKKRVRITGWSDMPTFRDHLAAADIAVQLRTESRGETSAAVLDCMNYALPTIVNANGSMADLPSDALCILPDAFADEQLVDALETLWQSEETRNALGRRAQDVIRGQHAPHACAEQYAVAIEAFHARSQSDSHSLVKAIAALGPDSPSDSQWRALAQAIAQTLPAQQASRQLFLDVSATCRTDLNTGIERVARALVLALLDSPPAGFRVEPVYLSNEHGQWHYRYARRFSLKLLECPPDAQVDDVVEPRNGDIVLGLDLSGSALFEAEAAGLFAGYRNEGVAVYFMVHDLLPVQMPEVFPPGADKSHARWLHAVAQFDGAIGVSKTVADELADWISNNIPERTHPYKIGWSHHGADVGKSSPTRGLPDNAEQTLAQLGLRPSFLMVGTIEPRKGYLQSLAAFTQLWQEGVDVNLVIVGNEGWRSLPDSMRCTIPEMVSRLRNHPELNKHLFWLEGISDEYLEKVYRASACLIAASAGEGFGLPLIEAGQHELPLIVRDIPVFREVAGDGADYFTDEPHDLCRAVKDWLSRQHEGTASRPQKIEFLSWQDSASRLMQVVVEQKWHKTLRGRAL